MRELHYRLGARARGLHPGSHRSGGGGPGFEFRTHLPLADAPDARRLDLLASLRDPFGGWFVRRFDERKAITVAAVADLSASMGFEAGERRLDVLADFVACLGVSAWRAGDRFAFVGADERVRPDWLLPPTRQRAAALELAERLRRAAPAGRSAAGLADAARYLPAQRSLVFLLSDFHLPLAFVADVLDSLAAHDVVPVVLWDPVEFALSAAHGLAHVVDPETGRRRLVWWRPALRRAWRASQQARRDELVGLFQSRLVRPLFVEGRFDADAVTRHFHA